LRPPSSFFSAIPVHLGAAEFSAYSLRGLQTTLTFLFEHPLHDVTMTSRGGAFAWPVLRRFIDAEARIAARMSRRPATAALYEFLRFGMKQAWACLFGALMLSLLLATYFF
jgi:hypothetical protein